jgi:recombination protein RecA
VDTGCFILNACLSDADINKGIPVGKRIILAGPSGVAKSLFTFYLFKAYLEQKPNVTIALFETEGSTVNEMADALNVDKSRIIILPVHSVEDLDTQVCNLLSSVKEEQAKAKQKGEEKPELLIGLDSLGMLRSNKEYADAMAGEQKADFTRAKAIKGFFRKITLDLALTGTTFIAVNHTYANIGAYGAAQKSGGGSGVEYAPDVCIVMSKAKEKDGTSRVGSVITFKIEKSRFIPEDQKFQILLLYSKGIYKYSQMFEEACECGIFEKSGAFVKVNGENMRRKDILNKPEEYFTEEVMAKIAEHVKRKYSFGNDTQEIDGEDDD